MNGAEKAIETAIAHGVEVMFTNPGTTEMPFVAALDSVPGMRGILSLHENVCTGAADGYGRLTGKPALTLLHLGPGFSNGLTNLHNARRAHSPIVNLIGDHATWHVRTDPPLNSPIDFLARSVSGFVRHNVSADHLAIDMADAIRASMNGAGQVATLSVPHDAQWTDTAAAVPSFLAPPPRAFSGAAVEAAAKTIKAGKRIALYLGGDAIKAEGLMLCGRVAATCGADLIAETFFARMDRGVGLPVPIKLPYFPEQAKEVLKDYDAVVVVGSTPPVAFFGYPDKTSEFLRPDQACSVLCGVHEDVNGALAALCDVLKAPAAPDRVAEAKRPDVPRGALTADALSTTIAALQPDDAVIMNESATAGNSYYAASVGAPSFTEIQLTGGAIGQGPGCAVGLAVAGKGRKVINFQADGSAAYSVQALWTQAREKLDVVTVLASNRRYNILQFELYRAGIKNPGPQSLNLTRLSDPDLAWPKIAEGFGVPACSVDTAEALAKELEAALSRDGPSLIEAVMA